MDSLTAEENEFRSKYLPAFSLMRRTMEEIDKDAPAGLVRQILLTLHLGSPLAIALPRVGSGGVKQ